VMLCTAGSRLFGYVRQALLNYYFGGSGAADAINAVFNIPNYLRKLFAEGAFSSAFIPVLSTTLAEDGALLIRVGVAAADLDPQLGFEVGGFTGKVRVLDSRGQALDFAATTREGRLFLSRPAGAR